MDGPAARILAMGAPKQKWTAEEEAALKAGVRKHGSGKWQTILRDPEFSLVLRSRSNVDLKDKWRNINVTLSGLGSREKARLALKRNPQTPKRQDKPVVSENSASQNEDEDVVKNDTKSDVKNDVNNDEAIPLATPSEAEQVADPRRNLTRLDNIILEALATLKEPKGADKNVISAFIEDRYWAPPHLKKVLSGKLKTMAADGKLIKEKHRYRIAPGLTHPVVRRNSTSSGNQGERKRSERKESEVLIKTHVDAELERMRGVSAEEAAALAAQAVAEAEAAIAATEAAAREAEAFEAEAEASQIFYRAVMKAVSSQSVHAC
ncbi:Single myb histone 1-like protein [Drosera capensis]